MPIPDNKFPNATCACGRQANVVHCPACGSENIERRLRAPAERIAELTDDKLAIAALKQERWWVCRRCCLKFCDYERAKHCEAPPVKALRTAINRASAQVLDWTPEERKARLNEMFKNVNKKGTTTP